MDKEKEDFIARRVNDVGKIFGMASKDFMALMLVLSLVANAYLLYLFVTLNLDFSDRIVEEVRKQNKNETIPAMERRVDEKVEEKVSPIKEGVEKATNKVDTILKTLQE